MKNCYFYIKNGSSRCCSVAFVIPFCVINCAIQRACEPQRVAVGRPSRYRFTPLLKGLFIPQGEKENPRGSLFLGVRWGAPILPSGKNLLCHTRKRLRKRPWVACPVCFENLAKVFSFPKTSMLSKTKQQDRHAHNTVTQHQIHVAVSVRALPRHRALYCTSAGACARG